MTYRLALTGLVAGAALLFAGSVHAAGGDSAPAPSCPAGQIKDSDGKCKPADNTAIDRDARVSYGIALAQADRYEEAIAALMPLAGEDDPQVLNYLGFAHRKAGRLETGIGYYQRALAANPDYVLAREYLGEAYLTMGRLDLAEAQLAEIEARCGDTCGTYFELADRIEDYRERQWRG